MSGWLEPVSTLAPPQGAGFNDEPRRLFDELGTISLVDVMLPTRKGVDIRKRYSSVTKDRAQFESVEELYFELKAKYENEQ